MPASIAPTVVSIKAPTGFSMKNCPTSQSFTVSQELISPNNSNSSRKIERAKQLNCSGFCRIKGVLFPFLFVLFDLKKKGKTVKAKATGKAWFSE